jgi:hypothetical protein
MLWGLPRIQHKSAKLACTVLVTSSILALAESFYLLDRSTKHRLWVWLQYHILHVVRLAYLNEMQDASA